MFFAVRNINIFCFCSSQIISVETFILHDFAELKMNLCAFWFMDTQTERACHILADIKDCFILRCMNQSAFECFMFKNRRTESV